MESTSYEEYREAVQRQEERDRRRWYGESDDEPLYDMRTGVDEKAIWDPRGFITIKVTDSALSPEEREEIRRINEESYQKRILDDSEWFHDLVRQCEEHAVERFRVLCSVASEYTAAAERYLAERQLPGETGLAAPAFERDSGGGQA